MVFIEADRHQHVHADEGVITALQLGPSSGISAMQLVIARSIVYNCEPCSGAMAEATAATT